MPKITSTVNRVSNFVIKEQWLDRNWCRDAVAVDLTGVPELCETVQGAPLAQVGVVVYEDADALGTWVLMDATYVAGTDKIGVIVDDRLGDDAMYDITNGQQVVNVEKGTTDVTELAVIVKGDAMVRLGGMIYPSAQEATVIAGLEAVDIMVSTQLAGIHSEAVGIPFEAVTA